MLAALSGDERMIEAFKNGQDIHRSTASLVFDTPFDDVTDLQRRNAKAVNLVSYMVSARLVCLTTWVSQGKRHRAI